MDRLDNREYDSIQANKESSPAGYYGKIPFYFRLLFSLPIMGLFIVWLFPLYSISKGEDTRLLLVVLALAAVILLLCGLLPFTGWRLFSVQFVVITLSWLYVCGEGWDLSWVTTYLTENRSDLFLFLSTNISEVSSESRLLILLIGWGMLVASVQHLALFRGSISLFSIVTLVYLLILDRLTGIRALQEIVISSGLILWLKGMCRLLLMRERNSGHRDIPYAVWGVAAFATAAGITAVSWLGGELYSPQPGSTISLRPMIGRMQTWAEGEKLEQSRDLSAVTGYGSTGSELGAPLSSSHEPVFTAESELPVYWRGESLAYYDGRHWGKSNDEFIPLNLTSLPDKSSSVPVNSEEKVLLQRIQLAVPSAGGQPLFGGSGVINVPVVELADGSRLGFVFANAERDSFRLPTIRGSARVTGYTVESVLPETDPEVLRGLAGSDPVKVKDIYLELPASLPGRVRELAQDIIAPARSRYDAAVAVRDYLHTHYSYTLNTRVPGPGVDFVDDFLFEARQGYCVHFATAMVVLLRSTDIPARFVQGYGPGTAEGDSVPQRYAVTQADAHAWVEVYFPGEGWVPFDPTPGSPAAAGSALPEASSAAVAPPPKLSPPAALGAGTLPARLRQGGATPAPLAAAALLPAAAWRWRRSLALLLAMRSSRMAKPERLLAAGALAWQGLAARYGQPPPGVTGREYAASLPIEDARLRAAVWQFVRQWETLAYSPASAAVRSPVTASTVSVSEFAVDFLNVCLSITLRLS